MHKGTRTAVGLGVALALAVATGCAAVDGASGGDDGDGKADGDGDGDGSYIGYIQANTPFYWAPSDYATFVSVAASIGMPANPTPIDTADALTQRVQGWVDRIDDLVRNEVRATTGSELVAPKPIVEILPSGSTFNAWVSPTLACTGVQAARADPSAPSRSYLSSAQVDHGVAYQCARPAYPGLSDFQTFWNRHEPACAVGSDGSVGGAGCDVETYGAPGELSVISTAQYVHVSSDLIAAVDERTLVVILAHELGHYYRAHVTDARIQQYDFWYDTESDRKKVPVPAANAAQLQAAYQAIVNGPATVQPAIAGHYSPRFRTFILTQIAPLLAERTEPDFVCSAARDALGPWMSQLLSGYGIPTDAMTGYLDFEKKLVACAPSLNLAAAPGADALDAGIVIIAVLHAKLPSVSFPLHATLSQVLEPLNGKAQKLDKQAAALVAQVQQNHIGLYTIEEEADDISLELSSRLGISPDEVLASWLVFMDAITNAVPAYYRAQYDQEHTSCKALLDAGFTNSDGSPAFVPIRDLSEPHHSDCYRLFNFWREQKLRQYTTSTTLTFPDDWSTMQDEAKTLSANAAAVGQ